MQVHLVNTANRQQYLAEIEEMHRQRHEVFVEHLGWKALESPDKLDIDEFDTPSAVYLIIMDAGEVRGSCRMTPSWRPHSLNTLFSNYVEADVPTGPAIWEWSRHTPGHPKFSKSINHEARHLLSLAALEFALSRGVELYTGIVDTRFASRVTDLGWIVEPLGLPQTYPEGFAFAFKMAVRAGHLNELRKRLGREAPALIELPGDTSPERARLARKSIELATREASLLHRDRVNAALEAMERVLEMQP